MAPVSSETLQYFNLGARGEYIRNAYKYGNIKFNDERYEFSEWPALKPKMPLGQLPVMTMAGDDVQYVQSLAMLRYVGARAGLYPKAGTKDHLVVEDILETTNELWSAIGNVGPEARAEFIATKVAKGLAHVENLINAHSGVGTKFVLGDHMSVADLLIHGYVAFFSSGFFDNFPKDTFEKYKVIMKIYGNVESQLAGNDVADVSQTSNLKPITAETLQYFNLGARAEYIRNAYKYGNIEFTDQRYEFSEWPALKPNMPLGQLPVLTMAGDNMQYIQSLAMLRFVGARAGLYPKVGTKEQLVAEDILETVNELWSKMDSGSVKPEARPEFIATTVAKGLEHVEKLINAHSGVNTKFVLGDKMSVADLFIHGYVAFFSSGFFDNFPKDTFEKYSVIMKICKNVDSHFNITANNEGLRQEARATTFSKETLEYFNLGARAEYIRNAYKYGNIDFEDKRYEFSEWPALKSKVPLGQLPVMTMEGDNMQYVQSLAMLRFVGGRAGLYPQVGTKDQLVVEDIMETTNEIWSAIGSVGPEARPEFIATKVAKGLQHVERLINGHSGDDAKFVLGDQMSVADLFIHGYVAFFSSGYFDNFPKDTYEKYSVITKICNNVDSYFNTTANA